jgi:hypothetical protein
MEIKEVYIADARVSPGRVYIKYSRAGGEHIFFERPSGKITSIAFSQDGTLHFVNMNDNRIFRVIRGREDVIHTHHTYVRDIVIDINDTIYFSEASGAGDDGRIYELQGGNPSHFQDIRLDDVGGYWSGNFAFDWRHDLYVSTGNSIPASIYRLGTEWEEIHKEETDCITGFSFLACDLLCYTNWDTEAYLLECRSDTKSLIYSEPHRVWLSDIAFKDPQVEDETIHEGWKEYRCDVTLWREDGVVYDDWNHFFPDIDEYNENIGWLLWDIGAPTDAPSDDAEIWRRTKIVWQWLHQHCITEDDFNYDALCDYRDSLDRCPSIDDLAYMFGVYGGFCWGERCTCMCKAQIFATLLYKVGIPPDRIAIAGGRYAETNEHIYIVLRIRCHWYYLDPTSSRSQLGEHPENVAGVSEPVDYLHPHNLVTLPRSSLRAPMLVR